MGGVGTVDWIFNYEICVSFPIILTLFKIGKGLPFKFHNYLEVNEKKISVSKKKEVVWVGGCGDKFTPCATLPSKIIENCVTVFPHIKYILKF